MKNKLLAVLCSSVLSLAVPSASFADDYPQRNVEVINQFGPGGGTDMFIRAIGQPFRDITGRNLVGISITGGGGVPAATRFFSTRADGHTLMAIGPEEIINSTLGRFDLERIQPVARIQYDQGLFYVSKDSPFNTAEELVEHARANPNKVSIAVTGAAGFDETLVGLWNFTSEALLSPIPFNTGAESIAAVMGGHADVLYEEYGAARALLEADELKPIVLFSDERIPTLPDVPTAKELGFDVTLGRWRGFALKADDQPEHAASLFKIFEEAAQDERYKKIEEQDGLQYRSVILNPDEFSEFIKKEQEVYNEVLQKLGHK